MKKKRRVALAACVSAALLVLTAAGVSVVHSQSAPQQATVKQLVPNHPAPPVAPEQPIPFSHKKHVSMGLQCTMCHTNPEPGAQMTFPPTQTCMNCHVAIATDKPAIKKLTELSKSGQPIDWVRVYKVAPGITWNHRKHLNAGMQCVMCHGEVGELDHMTQKTSVTTMASCISCHESKGAEQTCQTCHAWPASTATTPHPAWPIAPAAK
jgi:Cytochrome c7 and related cytochrome c/Class III cytochrome C family